MNALKFITFMSISIFLVGCWSTTENTAVNTNVSNTESNSEAIVNEDQNAGTDNENSGSTTTANINTNKPDAELSPTETLKAFDDATIAQDADKIKRHITKGSLAFFEKEAKKQGMTFKEMVERPNDMPTVETPEMRNEKINGNTATVEAKNRVTGSFDEYFLVKENGVWKVDYEKYLKEKIAEINKGAKSLPETK